ncbi:MAG TPA: WGR domain-containing protein [Acetobacteraceae bacterium]|nr:WGR domain-containing protein [Acetobacteraceae bacterium]
MLIHRRDPERNMARFYAVRLQADLLDGRVVVREWGRTGQPGQVRAELAPAQVATERLAKRKRGRGYR